MQIPYHKRIGHSKVKIIRDSLRTMQYITEVAATYNPLKLFILISGFLILLSLAFAAHAAIALNGVTLLAAVIFFTGACVVFALGLIADPIGKIRRQLYDDAPPSA